MTGPVLIDFGDDWDREPRPDQLELFEPPPRTAPPHTPPVEPPARRVETKQTRGDLL